VSRNRKQESKDNTQNSRSGDANTRLTSKGKRGSAQSTGDRQERAAEPGTVIGELQRRDREPGVPQSAGRGQRNRGMSGPADAEGGELHSGQQLGASRAVRQTQPNRKRRVA
jgi:hypothetical protein